MTCGFTRTFVVDSFRGLATVCGMSIAPVAPAEMPRFNEANTATRAVIRGENCFMGKKCTRGKARQYCASYIATLYLRQGHNPCGPCTVSKTRKTMAYPLNFAGHEGKTLV